MSAPLDWQIKLALEERQGIMMWDGNLARYPAAQAACREMVKLFGEELRPALLEWLAQEKKLSGE